MKTTFLTIATVLLLVTAVNKTFAAANPVKPQEYTDLTWIHKFYKIEVHGNVHLHLISGPINRVEMNNTYYDHNALVQVENGILRITCYCTERLNVWVTVNDLRDLSAYENVWVETEGKFAAMALDVKLFNKAKADLNLYCCFANIQLNDQAKADLSGTAMESKLVNNYAATLNASGFVAEQITKNRIDPIWETRIGYAEDADTVLMDDDQQSIANVGEIRYSSASNKQIEIQIPDGVTRFTITRTLIN